MTSKPRVNLARLTSMLAAGKTQKECADYFKVSKPAITKRVKQLQQENKIILEYRSSANKWKVNHANIEDINPITDSGDRKSVV